jgi:hypothetical protein
MGVPDFQSGTKHIHPLCVFVVKITLGTSSYKNNNVLVEVRGKGFYRAEFLLIFR